ncbi:obscurin-like isoform X2 [Branchiostoma floridae x Branchiostoma belcheri]
MAPPAAGPKSPPKIVSSPQELAIQLGQPLSLTCGVQGNPRPTVTWYFNGKDTAGLAGFRLAEKGNSVSLEISRFDVPCFGNYLCVARNELGEAKFTLALDAQADQLGSSAERLEPPDLKDWDFVKKEAGGNLSVEFKCRATGQPPPDVLWYRGARKLRSDADFVVTYEKGEVSFLIKKVNKSSSGEYKCVASNPAGKSTTTARLAVKEQLVGGKVRYIIDDISTAASVNGSPQAQKAQAQTTAGEPGQAQASVAKSAAAAQENAAQKPKEEAKPPAAAQGKAAAAAPAAGGGSMAATIVEKPAELFGIDGQPQEFRIKVAGDPHPTIQWQKGKFLKIKEGPRYHVLFDEETKEDVMVIKELRPADAGTYKCNVFNPGGQANCAVVLHVKDRKDISEEEVLKILEKTDPKDYERVALMYGITDFRNLLKHVHIKKKKPAEIVKELEDVEGQQEKEVTFMAEVVINDKDLKVEWEKNLDILTPGQKYKMEHKGDLVMLTIKDLRHDDEGKYKLVVGDCTSSAMLVVKKAPARFRGLMKGCTVFLHERAEFTVEVSRADAELQWFFKGKPIDFTTKRYAIETMGNRRTLVIRRTEFEDMGDYSCSTGDDKTQAKLTVKEERYKFTSELRDCEAPVGGDARFECEVSSESAKVTWFRNKEELTAGEKYQIIKEGLRHVLIIKNIEMEKDRGQYICKTKDGSSTGKLIIREPPPGFVSELKSLTGFFKRDVTLECEVAKEDARVKWFKNGKEINLARLKGKYDCQVKGTRRILIIKNLAWDDTAEYSCEAPGGKTSCTMTVEEAPIEFKQQLKDSKAFPKESVTFECELSTEDTEVHWFRNGVEIKMGGRYQIKKDGLKRYLIITGLTMEDMGEYTIEAGIKKKFKSSAKLAIEAKPVKIEKGLKDVSALDKDPELVLEATISELDGEVSWLWNGKPIPKELFDSGKFKVVSDKKKRKLVITNVGRDDGGEYTLVTKDGKSSCNVSVSDRPVKIKTGLRDVSAREKDPEVILEAEISIPDGEVTWLWNGQAIPVDLLSSGRFQIISDGRKRKLKIKDPEKAFCGEFTLVTNSGQSKCKLDISDRLIQIKSGLKNVKATDREPEVTLEAEVSEPDGEVTWLRNGKPIPQDLLSSGKIQIIADGKKRKLKIKDLNKDDAGEFTLKTNDGTSKCKLDVEDRKIGITSKLKDLNALNKDPEVTLEAEVSEPDGEVTWLKDGKPIPKKLLDSGKVQIIADGKKRKLKIKDLGKDDAGEYTLKTNAGTSSCNLGVQDRPVKIKSKLKDVKALDKDPEVTLEAEVSEPDGEVTWLKDGKPIPKELLDSGKVQIIADGKKRKLKIKDLDKDDAGEYTLKTNDGTSSCKLGVEDRPVKIKSKLKDVKALDKDPEVTLEAEVSEPDGEVTWLKDGKPIPKELLDSGKVQIIADGKKRKLKIKDLDKDDAGEYTLKTNDGESSCKLGVEDRPVKIKSKLKDVKALDKDPEVTLEAEVSEPDGEVTWLKDGKPIPKELLDSGKVQIIADGKKRKLKIKDLRKDDAGEYTLKTNDGESSCKLGVEDRPVKIKSKLKDVKALDKDPEVTLEAEVSESDGEVTWLKDGKPIPKELLDSGKVQIIADGKKRKLKIKDLGKDDAGEYTLKTNDGTSSCKLGVEDRPVKIKSGLKDVKAMDKDPEVTLEAEVSEADGAVTWLKNGKPIPQDLLDSGKVQIVADGNKRKLKLKDLGKDDAGEYTMVTNDGKSSCKLNVADRPVNIVSGLRDADVVENSPEAALEAEVSEADGEVTWLKNGKPIPKALLDSGKLQIVADGKKRKLVIKNPGKDDAGEYTLVTKDGKSNCKINVTDEPVKITKELQPVKVTEGDKAELACEVHKDGAQVQWLKNGKPIPDKDLKNIKIVADGKTHKLIFLDAEPKDSGEYSVKTTGGTSNANVNVKEIPAGFTSSLNGAECEYGEDVTFAVELTKPKAEVKWLLNGKVIDPDRPRGKYQVVTDGTKRKLIVKNCNGKDNGEITCVFGDKEATSQLKVNEPVGIKKGLEGSVLKEEEKGKLTVELNREKPGGGDIKWFKNGKEITLGGKYKMQRDGNKCHLLIDPVDLTDNAEFTCMAGDSSTSAKATVDEKPAIITSELQVPEVIEGEKAEFVLGLNKDNKLDKIKWFKDGKEVYESSRIHLQQRGNNYVLVINRAQMEDAGTWSCQIDGSTSQGTFVVNEPPLKITSKLRRVDAIEGEDVKFELEVSRENGEVTWFKDGVEINPAANPDKYEIKVIGLKRVLIVKGCALGDSGQITVVAEKDKKTAVLNVEKPFQMERVPTFTLPLRDTGFFAGKTIVLTVTVSVHPEPDITWTKNGQEVLPGGRVRFSKDYGRYTLEILNAQPEDEGEYAVTAVNPFGKDFTSCKVTPKTRGHEEDWYVPLFRRYMVTQEVLQGKDARFECKVNGNPVPEVKWMKGDVEIKDGPRHVISFDGKTAALEVRNVSKEDLGTYTCIITNAAGSQECHADIAFDTGLPERKKKRGARRAAQAEEEIEYRKVTEYELEYDENVNVAGGGKVRKVSEEELHKLFLEVEAEEAERLKLGLTIEEWEIRQMERLGLTPEQWNMRKRQRMLLLSQLDMEMRMKLGLDMESATMVDGVASGAGFGRTTQVDVHMHGPREPKFKLPLRDTNFLVGGTLTLSVTVNVHPENQVTWYKNGQEIKVGGRIRTGQDFGRYTLTILDASADDIGEYSCASKNPYGNDKCSCQVTIREHGHEEYFSAPLFRRYMVNCDALEGKDGTFTCKINAKPQAEIRWERDDKEIVSDDRHVIQYDGVTATLTVKGVTKADLGTYHCTATNCAGSVTCHAELALDRDLPITRGRRASAGEADVEYVKRREYEFELADGAPGGASPSLDDEEAERQRLGLSPEDWELHKRAASAPRPGSYRGRPRGRASVDVGDLSRKRYHASSHSYVPRKQKSRGAHLDEYYNQSLWYKRIRQYYNALYSPGKYDLVYKVGDETRSHLHDGSYDDFYLHPVRDQDLSTWYDQKGAGQAGSSETNPLTEHYASMNHHHVGRRRPARQAQADRSLDLTTISEDKWRPQEVWQYEVELADRRRQRDRDLGDTASVGSDSSDYYVIPEKFVPTYMRQHTYVVSDVGPIAHADVAGSATRRGSPDVVTSRRRRISESSGRSSTSGMGDVTSVPSSVRTTRYTSTSGEGDVSTATVSMPTRTVSQPVTVTKRTVTKKTYSLAD